MSVSTLLSALSRSERVLDEDAEHGEDDDAQAAAEVRAVGRRREQRQVEAQGVPHPVRVAVTGGRLVALADPALEPRLHREQRAGGQHEHRHEQLEGVGRGRQQRHRAGHPTEQGHRQQGADPVGLHRQLAPVAERPADVAGQQGHGVGHVGRERRVAHRHERGNDTSDPPPATALIEPATKPANARSATSGTVNDMGRPVLAALHAPTPEIGTPSQPRDHQLSQFRIGGGLAPRQVRR